MPDIRAEDRVELRPERIVAAERGSVHPVVRLVAEICRLRAGLSSRRARSVRAPAAILAIARLTDIIEAVELIRGEIAGVTFQNLETDKRKRWLVERGIEIISEASRHLSDELKARHPEIPWSKVAGIGNVLRHEYERVAHDVLWRVARDDLPPLEKVCREELAMSQAGDVAP